MKKIMTLMLGLALVLGTTTAFAADDTKADKKEKKSKKGSKKGAKSDSTSTTTAK